MKRIKTETISLQFFTEEDTLKSAYISMVHNQLLHSCQDPMYHAIKDEAYDITKEQIVEVINKFQECVIKNKLTTKQTICTIIAEQPCEFFLADLVDLQYYHKENDDYN